MRSSLVGSLKNFGTNMFMAKRGKERTEEKAGEDEADNGKK